MDFLPILQDTLIGATAQKEKRQTDISQKNRDMESPVAFFVVTLRVLKRSFDQSSEKLLRLLFSINLSPTPFCGAVIQISRFPEMRQL